LTPILTLNHIEWYTTTEKINNLTFGYVHLGISGVTTGDKVTVVTYRDGVISEQELDLDQKKNLIRM
jgi:FMN-dependent NADH-azoreductase